MTASDINLGEQSKHWEYGSTIAPRKATTVQDMRIHTCLYGERTDSAREDVTQEASSPFRLQCNPTSRASKQWCLLATAVAEKPLLTWAPGLLSWTRVSVRDFFFLLYGGRGVFIEVTSSSWSSAHEPYHCSCYLCFCAASSPPSAPITTVSSKLTHLQSPQATKTCSAVTGA